MRSNFPAHLLVLWLATLVAVPALGGWRLMSAGVGAASPVAPCGPTEEEDSETEAAASLPSSCRRRVDRPEQPSRSPGTPAGVSVSGACAVGAAGQFAPAPPFLSVRHLVPRYGE